MTFDWGTGAPARGVPADHFTVRWVGSIAVPKTDTYKITASGDDWVNVWIDNKNVIKRGGNADLKLAAGERHDFRVEYGEQDGNASLYLKWSAPGVSSQTIPASAFSVQRGKMSGLEELVLAATDPTGRKRAVRLSPSAEGISAHVNGDVLPGVYALELTDVVRGHLAPLLDEKGQIPFAVLRDTDESRMQPLDETDIGFIRKYTDLVVAASVEQVVQALRGRTFGEEVWRYLALGAFALLLFELALTRWIAIQRGTGETSDVVFHDRTEPSASFRDQLKRMQGAGK